MKLSENEAHVWYFNALDNLEDIDCHSAFLSSEEMVKVNKFKFTKDRTIHIFSRSVLRMLSGRYLDLDPHKLKFTYGEYGKPDYDVETAIKFNVSHSGDAIVFAFARDSEIGVDVEKVKADFNVLDIAKNFFSPDEIQALEHYPKKEQNSAFYRCWTRKESFIKAKGSGLSFPLESFTVSLDQADASLLRTEWDKQEKALWNMFSFSPEKDYIGALSVSEKITAVTYRDWKGL